MQSNKCICSLLFIHCSEHNIVSFLALILSLCYALHLFGILTEYGNGEKVHLVSNMDTLYKITTSSRVRYRFRCSAAVLFNGRAHSINRLPTVAKHDKTSTSKSFSLISS